MKCSFELARLDLSFVRALRNCALTRDGHEDLNEDEEESERAKDEETEVANGEEEN